VHPFGVQVQVFGEATRTVHGDTTRTQVGVIDGCAVAPAGSSEDNDQRAQVVANAVLFVPPSTVPITAQSRVRLPDGTEWLVEGVPQDWRNPFTGWYPGREIQLRRVTG
jgi:hypothetical protein